MKTLTLMFTSILLSGAALMAGDKNWKAEASGDLSADEVKFVMKAAKSGKAEAAMGELGKSGGSKDEIKDFAKMIADDHNAANEKLMAIAQKNSVTLPEPKDHHKDSMAKLSKLQGAEFDAAFLDEMLAGHEKSVALFKDAQGKVKNEALKDFVDNTLPTLEKHLEKVKELKGMKDKDPEKAQS